MDSSEGFLVDATLRDCSEMFLINLIFEVNKVKEQGAMFKDVTFIKLELLVIHCVWYESHFGRFVSPGTSLSFLIR